MQRSSSLVAAPLHLLPCAQCGQENGFNALRCWSCDEPMPPMLRERVDFQIAPAAAARSSEWMEKSALRPVEASGKVRSGFASRERIDPLEALLQAFTPLPQASRQAVRRRRRTLLTGAAWLATLLAVASYPLYRTSLQSPPSADALQARAQANPATLDAPTARATREVLRGAANITPDVGPIVAVRHKPAGRDRGAAAR
jgi:hypothetical protein